MIKKIFKRPSAIFFLALCLSTFSGCESSKQASQEAGWPEFAVVLLLIVAIQGEE